jgi:drug/metabolite transporter (DMT)-like permease
MNSPPPEGADSRTAAILLILSSAFIFAVSDAAAKLIVGSLPPVEVLWMRSAVVAALSVPVILLRRGPGIIRTAHPVLQIIRGLSVLGASLLFLWGLIDLPVADASAINFIWPVLITVFSIIMLKEKVGVRRALATALGFAGMLIIIRPGSSAFHPAAVFPLGAAVVWSFASVLTRMMSADEAAETTILWSAAVSLVVSTILLPFVFVMPGWREIGIGLFIGIGSATAHAMIVFAFSRAPASALAPFSYTQLIWAAVCGYVLFGTFPDRWVVLGAAFIAASGIYTAHRERIRQRERLMTPITGSAMQS